MFKTDLTRLLLTPASIFEKKMENNFINNSKAPLQGSRMCILFISIVLIKVTFHFNFRRFQSSAFNVQVEVNKVSRISVSSFIID